MNRSGTLILTLGFAMLLLAIPTAVAASGDRLALGHVTLTLPSAVDATDVSTGSAAEFNCTSGNAICSVDVNFVAEAVRPDDLAQAESYMRTVIRANTEANLILWDVFSTFDYTTQAGLTGVTTTYELRDRFGFGYVMDTFTLVDGVGNIRAIEFQYQGGVDRPSFNDGQSDWYAMIDGMTTNGS